MGTNDHHGPGTVSPWSSDGASPCTGSGSFSWHPTEPTLLIGKPVCSISPNEDFPSGRPCHGAANIIIVGSSSGATPNATDAMASPIKTIKTSTPKAKSERSRTGARRLGLAWVTSVIDANRAMFYLQLFLGTYNLVVGQGSAVQLKRATIYAPGPRREIFSCECANECSEWRPRPRAGKMPR